MTPPHIDFEDFAVVAARKLMYPKEGGPELFP